MRDAIPTKFIGEKLFVTVVFYSDAGANAFKEVLAGCDPSEFSTNAYFSDTPIYLSQIRGLFTWQSVIPSDGFLKPYLDLQYQRTLNDGYHLTYRDSSDEG